MYLLIYILINALWLFFHREAIKVIIDESDLRDKRKTNMFIFTTIGLFVAVPINVYLVMKSWL